VEAFLSTVASFSDVVFERLPSFMQDVADSGTEGSLVADLIADPRVALENYASISIGPELQIVSLNYAPEGEGVWYAVARVPVREDASERVLSTAGLAYVGSSTAIVINPVYFVTPLGSPAILREKVEYIELIESIEPADLEKLAQLVEDLDEAADEGLMDSVMGDLRQLLSDRQLTRATLSNHDIRVIDFARAEVGVDVGIGPLLPGWVAEFEGIATAGLSSDRSDMLVQVILVQGF